jgi:acetyl esterase/lipase
LAHDRGGPVISLQLLQYPMLDDRTALRSDLDAVVWTNASNRYAWSAYLGHPVDDTERRPYSSAARRDDLSDLPPAWIGIGAIDLFHDESVAYADRLRAAGVPCELHIVPGMYHAAERFAPSAPSMVAMLDSMTAALGSAATV